MIGPEAAENVLDRHGDPDGRYGDDVADQCTRGTIHRPAQHIPANR